MVDEQPSVGPLTDLDDEPTDSATGDLDALVTEHRNQGVGPLWVALIREASGRTARHYNPVIYARAAFWDDESISDLVQDVVVRLIEKAQLDYICDVASDYGHARALLFRQVKMTLADRRQRTSVDNLYDRATERLGAQPFAVIRRNPTVWGLVGEPRSPHQPTRRLLPVLAALPRLPGRGDVRGSSIWTTGTLTDALTLICREVGELAEGELRRILDGALTVFATTELVTGEPGADSSSEDLSPEHSVMVTESVERLIASLTAEEAAVLAGKWIGDSDGDIAETIGVSRPTTAKYKESAFSKIRDELVSHDQTFIEAVFARLQSRVIAKAAGGAS